MGAHGGVSHREDVGCRTSKQGRHSLKYSPRLGRGADENLDWLDGQPQRSAALHEAE